MKVMSIYKKYLVWDSRSSNKHVKAKSIVGVTK